MRKGFTILEILLVISVIAVLIGIALPRMKGLQDEAKNVRAKSELKMLMSAVESYYMHRSPNSYPATTATLVASVLSAAVPRIVPMSIPYDPFGATATTEYNYMANGRYYAIWSVGISGTGSVSAVNSVSGVVTTAAGVICITNGSGC